MPHFGTSLLSCFTYLTIYSSSMPSEIAGGVLDWFRANERQDVAKSELENAMNAAMGNLGGHVGRQLSPQRALWLVTWADPGF